MAGRGSRFGGGHRRQSWMPQLGFDGRLPLCAAGVGELEVVDVVEARVVYEPRNQPVLVDAERPVVLRDDVVDFDGLLSKEQATIPAQSVVSPCEVFGVGLVEVGRPAALGVGQSVDFDVLAKVHEFEGVLGGLQEWLMAESGLGSGPAVCFAPGARRPLRGEHQYEEICQSVHGQTQQGPVPPDGERLSSVGVDLAAARARRRLEGWRGGSHADKDTGGQHT